MKILAQLLKQEDTPAKSPWWLTLLRLTLAGIVVLAMAGPILNPQENLISSDGSLALVFDDGWASATDWEQRKDVARNLAVQARDNEQLVSLFSSSGSLNWEGKPIQADEAIRLIDAAIPNPLRPDHERIANQARAEFTQAQPGFVAWLSDGLSRDGGDQLLVAFLESGAELQTYLPDMNQVMVIDSVKNDPDGLKGELVRADTIDSQEASVIARDLKGVVLARKQIVFDADEPNAGFVFTEPVELRNQIARLEIEAVENAGAVHLLDESNRRRVVGLISGEKRDLAQPLLSPLYYVSRALEPFADIRNPEAANVQVTVRELLVQGVSAMVLADIGLLPEESEKALDEWINKGGLLIRFAGPRLAASPNRTLLPVDIRTGGRNLGGTLSWDKPKPVAPFELSSPFFGLEAPQDVVVRKQVLALQESELDAKTWATLEDGTPLVTAEQRGDGWIVLFHVGTNVEWSNLPLSGTFVEMLRRVVTLSRSGGARSNVSEEVLLAPLRLLDAMGKFVPPGPVVKSLSLGGTGAGNGIPLPSLDNPPGFYGTEEGFTALNLFNGGSRFELVRELPQISNMNILNYKGDSSFDFRPWLLLTAALLLLADCLAVLWMGGALRLNALRLGRTPAVLLLGLIIALSAAPTHEAIAADEEIDFSAALVTRLAYVVTGIDEVDRISEAGMRGLTYFLKSRTALEPGDPAGIDLTNDELAFYSLIYWPIDPNAAVHDAQTMARIDAYMKEGGSILFDTRDQVSGILGGTSSSPAALTLQHILRNLDIPPLEPVPHDHVLTKSFFLLEHFPGRFSGGDLWVESILDGDNQEGRPVRIGDGVSSVMITSNDFAGAWAVDSEYRPLLPTIPSDPMQRNYAFRVGVNLMMYALTGNYKADQVHLPDLMKRLGQ